MSREYNTENEFTREVKDSAAGLASKVKDKASQAGSAISETVDRQRGHAAAGLNRVAGSIHGKASSVPGGPRIERAAHGIANGLESTASYLRDHNFAEMKDDVVGACRKHPARALLSALVVGFFLGRAIRR